jgi:hypothetical protein
MFEKMNLDEMGKLLQKAQEESQKLEAEMQSKTYVAKAGGGMLSITMSGRGEVIDISIDDSLLQDKASLEILLISCINDVNKMLEDDKKNSAAGMFGSMGNLFGQK